MNIIIATATYYPDVNGASYSAQRLAYYLKKKGHRVLILASSRKWSAENFQHDGIDIHGFASFPVERIRAPIPFGLNARLKKIVEKFSPDVVHIETHFGLGHAAMKAGKKLGIPVVATNHFMPENLTHYLRLPEFFDRLLKRFLWWDFRRTFKHADIITSPTETAARLAAASGIKKSIRAISNGVDNDIFKPSNNGDYLKKKYNILLDLPILLFVGRLDKEKNLGLVIKASATLLKKNFFHLVIAGNGAEKENLERLVRELGISKCVTFTGFIPDADLPNLYPIADCFVMAGTAELQSMVTMEAMATGLSVIAVDAVALPELVHDGENGFLFQDGNVEEVASILEKVMGDKSLRQRMGRSSLEIIKKHSMQSVISEFELLYRSVSKK